MSGFDRIKPPERRLLERSPDTRGEAPDADPEGRAALFSAGSRRTGAPLPVGVLGLALHCSRCGAASALDAGTALRAALPLFLVAPWRRHPVFAVCPACRHRTWLRVGRAPT